MDFDCSSNILELMTPQEILQTFGTDEHSVPNCKMIHINLPGSRKKRLVDKSIYLSIEIGGTTLFDLTLKATDDFLATRYTPVWLALSNANAYSNISYDPLPNAMRDIGNFEMYQDVRNEAAIVVFRNDDESPHVEGIVTAKYAIKSLPSRLLQRGGKIAVGHHVLYKLHPPRNRAIRSLPIWSALSIASKLRTRRQSPNGGIRTIPKIVYPELLLVVDHNALRTTSITDALRHVLAFWNNVDMVYSALENPKIRLNIAGIILSGQLRTLLKTHRIVLCDSASEPCENVLGYANMASACPFGEMEKNLESRLGVATIQYYSSFFGVDTAVHEIAHLLGVRHDEGGSLAENCQPRRGFAMSPSTQWAHQSLKWSTCSKKAFRQYFSLQKSKCLDNKPIQVIVDEELLPGQWLSLDGQCRNFGYEKSCKLEDIPPCLLNACKPIENDCEISKFLPLPGSECGINKHCDISLSACVDN